MAEIVKVYRQAVPAVKFIGKRYSDEDRVDGSFANRWEQWHEQNWFELIDRAAGDEASNLYEDGNACLGYMRFKQGEPFQYWIGRFVPPATEVPEGFEALELAASELGVCWVQGKEPEIYFKEELCMKRMEEHSIAIKMDEQGAFWFFERYSPDRFSKPDKQGNIILDICYYIQPE